MVWKRTFPTENLCLKSSSPISCGYWLWLARFYNQSSLALSIFASKHRSASSQKHWRRLFPNWKFFLEKPSNSSKILVSGISCNANSLQACRAFRRDWGCKSFLGRFSGQAIFRNRDGQNQCLPWKSMRVGLCINKVFPMAETKHTVSCHGNESGEYSNNRYRNA